MCGIFDGLSLAICQLMQIGKHLVWPKGHQLLKSVQI